ncbi:MAG: permease-like cell division protein FtsX [bacterium]|nr:permease-like cell division protein FtsX [bacterium]
MFNKDQFVTKLKRVARTGWFNFWRNGTVSLASVLVMMVTLIVIGLISFSGATLDTVLAQLKDKIDIHVTFVPNATEEEVFGIKQNLESLPEVLLVTYASPEEVLEQFKINNANKPSILAALEELGANPFGARLNIKARDPSQYGSVAEFLEGSNTLAEGRLSIIDNIDYFDNKTAIDKLTNIIVTADRLGFALTILLAVISMLIAFNTIRLTIYIAKDEISVMRLVGASTTYIQGPFVVVGVIYGLIAGFLTLLIFLPMTYWLSIATEEFFDNFNIFSYYLRHFLEIAFIIMISGVLIGAASSLLAIRKYLKV